MSKEAFMALNNGKNTFSQRFTTAFRVSKIRPLNEMKKFAAGLKGLQIPEGERTVLFAPAPYLALLAEELRYEPILIGADHVSCPLGPATYKTSGLFCSCAPTGELCPDELAALGCRAVLLGCMDRRICLQESSEIISLKAAYAAVHGLRPYICVGELHAEHLDDTCASAVADQLDPLISMLRANDDVCVRDISLIYEPWADAPEEAPSRQQIEDAVGFIREYFLDRISYAPEILYGGGLGKNSIRDILSAEGICGLMLDADEM